MPETNSLARKKLVRRDGMPSAPIAPASYVELGVTTPFSFLRGASDAIELVRAKGRRGVGIGRPHHVQPRASHLAGAL